MNGGIKAVGRFINRGTTEEDGLLVGIGFQGSPFKENTVYEIVEVLGEMVIREIGPSIIAGRSERWDDSPVELAWGSFVEQILNSHDKELFLSRDEYKEEVRKDPLLARFTNPEQ